MVSSDVAGDVVWGPGGSPYRVTRDVKVTAKASLTVLPGTRVEMSPDVSINVAGQLLMLGRADDHVVVEGADSTPGSWVDIAFRPDTGQTQIPVSFIDYTEFRDGGQGTSPSCEDDGMVDVDGKSRVVVTNSTFKDYQVAGLSGGTIPGGFLGVYRSSFEGGQCGVDHWGGQGEYLDNTFVGGFAKWAFLTVYSDPSRFWYNTVHGQVGVAGDADMSVRYNQDIQGITPFGSWSTQLGDWSHNDWDPDLREIPVPACSTLDYVEAQNPPVIGWVDADCTDDHPYPAWYAGGYRYIMKPGLDRVLTIPEALLRPYHAEYGGVDTSTGVLRYTPEADLSVSDAGAAISAGRNYFSTPDRDLGTSDAGRGWRTSYSESMKSWYGVPTMTLSDDSDVPLADPTVGDDQYPGVTATYTETTDGSEVTTPDHTVYQFDQDGQLVGMLLGDPRHKLDIDNTDGKVSKVTGVSARFVDYHRGNGHLTSFTDSQGRQVEFGYDTDNRLVAATGVDGKTEHYDYDGDTARLTQVVSATGVVKLAAGYDSEGRVAWIEPEGSGRSTIAYDGSTRTITEPNDVEIVQQVDGYGRLVTESIPGATTRHVIYDGDGRRLADIPGIPAEAMTGYAPPAAATLFDLHGYPVLDVDPLGRTTTTTFNENSDPETITYPDGTTQSYVYDQDHRVKTVTKGGSIWHLTYDEFGQVASVTDGVDREETWTYETDGDLASSTSETDGTSTYTNNPRGLVTSITDPDDANTQITYTAWGATDSVTKPRGGTTTATFDDDRRISHLEDARGKVFDYVYDDRGRLSQVVDPTEHSSLFTYDANGRPKSARDANLHTYAQTYTPEGWVETIDGPEGTTSTTVYDPAGRPARVTDGLDQVTQTVYDRAGQTTRVDTPDGAHRSFTYDPMGRQTKYTDANSKNWTSTYTASGLLATLTNPLGKTETHHYDAVGRLTSLTDTAGKTVTYDYTDLGRTVTATDGIGLLGVTRVDLAGHLTSTDDGLGRTTSYTYNPDGLVHTKTAPGQPPVTYTYDLAGNLQTQTDERGKTITADYDDLGRLETRTLPDQTWEHFDYDNVGNLTGQRDRTGQTWNYEFDDLNRLKSETDPSTQQTSYGYDRLSRLTTTTDPTGVSVNVAYDPMGHPAVISDNAENASVLTYDPEGNLLTRADPAGRTITNTYDDLGQLKWRTYSGVIGSTLYAWDEVGNLTGLTRDLKTIAWKYDERRRLTRVTDQFAKQTSYDYDLADQLVQQTSPKGRTKSFTYYTNGLLHTATAGTQTTSYDYFDGGLLERVTLPRLGHYDFTYDDAGQLDTQTDPEQNTTDYDIVAGQLVDLTRPDGSVVHYDYDVTGRLVTQTAAGTTRSFGYDDAGRLESATTAGTGGTSQISLHYDTRGLLDTSADAAGTTTYTHDEAGYVSSVTPPVGGRLDFTYNAVGEVATVRGLTNLNYAYDKWGRLTGRTQQTGTSNASVGFGYDKDERLTSVTSGTSKVTATYDDDGLLATNKADLASVTNPSEGTTAYDYDGAGRLTRATLTALNGTTITSDSSYGWDDDSNRHTVTAAGSTPQTTSHDLAGRIQTSTDAQGTTTYEYNDNGQLTSIDRPGTPGDAAYTYDGFGELASASIIQAGGATTTQYSHDALGRVTSRAQTGGTSPGTTGYGYRADTAEPTSLTTTTGTTALARDTTGTLLAAKSPTGSISHAVPNVHGDLLAWRAQSNGAYTQTQLYDPFGDPTQTTASGGPGAELGIGYQSQVTDPATQLVDMNARAYDPKTGAFVSSDTLVGDLTAPVTLNRYTYANASPVNYTDPTGYSGISSLLTSLGTWASGLVTSAVHGITHGFTSMAMSAGGFIKSVSAQAQSFQARFTDKWHQLAGNAQSFYTDFTTSMERFGPAAHTALDLGGFFFDGFDVVNAAWYLFIDHDTKNALISFAAVIPLVGSFATGGRMVRHADEAADLASYAARNIAKHEDDLAPATAGLTRIAGSEGDELASAASVTRRLDNSPVQIKLSTRADPAHACSFAADTLVLMGDGTKKPIADIKPGDKVLTTDPKTGHQATRRVDRVFVHKDKLADLKLSDGTVLTTTEDHPYWSADDKLFEPAAELRHGERVLTSDGRTVEVSRLKLAAQPDRDAYNLAIHDVHTYHVGPDGILVHNECLGGIDSGALLRRSGSVSVLGKAKQTELDYANLVAERGYDVIVRGTSAAGADLLINGVGHELKTLTSGTQTSVIRNVQRGLAQSDRVIVNGAPASLSHADALIALDRLKGAGHLSGASEVIIETFTGRLVWTP